MIIAVDANIILSALLGGKPSSILFDSRFKFITANFTIREVKRYIPKLSLKLSVSNELLYALLDELPLLVYSKDYYRAKVRDARLMIGEIDDKDVDILALALKFDIPLWSEDKDFEKCGYAKTLKTRNFIE